MSTTAIDFTPNNLSAESERPHSAFPGPCTNAFDEGMIRMALEDDRGGEHGQFGEKRDLADETVNGEPVCEANSLLTGKRSGNFRYYGATATRILPVRRHLTGGGEHE
jgi:hypothetical protein